LEITVELNQKYSDIIINKNKLLQLYNAFLFFNLDIKQLHYFIFSKTNYQHCLTKNIVNIKCIKKKNKLKKFFVINTTKKKIISKLEVTKQRKKYNFIFKFSFEVNILEAKNIFYFLIEYIIINNNNLDIFKEKDINNFFSNKNIKFKYKYKLLKNLVIIKKLIFNIKTFKIDFLTQQFLFYIYETNQFFLLDELKIKKIENFVIYNYYHPLSALYKTYNYDLGYYNIYYLLNNNLTKTKKNNINKILLKKLNLFSKKSKLTLNESLKIMLLLLIIDLKIDNNFTFIENYINLLYKKVFIKNINIEKTLKEYYGLKYYIYKFIYKKKMNYYQQIMFKLNKIYLKNLKEYCKKIENIKNKKYFKLLKFYSIKNETIMNIHLAEFIKYNIIPEKFFKEHYFPYLCFIGKNNNNTKVKIKIIKNLINNIKNYKTLEELFM